MTWSKKGVLVFGLAVLALFSPLLMANPDLSESIKSCTKEIYLEKTYVQSPHKTVPWDLSFDCTVAVHWIRNVVIPLDLAELGHQLPLILSEDETFVGSNSSSLLLRSWPGVGNRCVLIYVIPTLEEYLSVGHFITRSGFLGDVNPYFIVLIPLPYDMKFKIAWFTMTDHSKLYSKVATVVYISEEGAVAAGTGSETLVPTSVPSRFKETYVSVVPEKVSIRLWYLMCPQCPGPRIPMMHTKRLFLHGMKCLHQLNTLVGYGVFAYTPGIHNTPYQQLRERLGWRNWREGPAVLVVSGIISRKVDFNMALVNISAIKPRYPHLKMCLDCDLSSSRIAGAEYVKVIPWDEKRYHAIYCLDLESDKGTVGEHWKRTLFVLKPLRFEIWVGFLASILLIGIVGRNWRYGADLLWTMMNQAISLDRWSRSTTGIIVYSVFILQQSYLAELTSNVIVPKGREALELNRELISQGFLLLRENSRETSWDKDTLERIQVSVDELKVVGQGDMCPDHVGRSHFTKCLVQHPGELAFLENSIYLGVQVAEMKEAEPKVLCDFVREPWMRSTAYFIFQSHLSIRAYAVMQQMFSGGIVQRWETAYKAGSTRQLHRKELYTYPDRVGPQPIKLQGIFLALLEIAGIALGISSLTFIAELLAKWRSLKKANPNCSFLSPGHHFLSLWDLWRRGLAWLGWLVARVAESAFA